jgi:lipoprotein-releasing system ATP-binding protein
MLSFPGVFISWTIDLTPRKTTQAAAAPLIRIEAVTRVFGTGNGQDTKLYVLRGVTMTVGKGQIVAIVGASGAGKSTLLHIIGTLDRPSSGKVLYDDVDAFALGDDELARFRNREIGFVFQFHHLLPEFSALENVAMPALIAGRKPAEVMDRAMSLLDDVGLRERAAMRPPKLSGGEAQRVAVARALMNSPRVILADEPTGNLDTANAQALHDLIWKLSREKGQTFVVVTHNEALARQSDKVAKIVDGVVQVG